MPLPGWTIHIDARAVPDGSGLALDVDPQARRVTLAPRVTGQGSAEVGQLAVYRVFYEGAATAPAAAWLRGPEAAALLDAVADGFRLTTVWSGDRVGEWTPGAWAAAVALADGVNAALDRG